MAAEPLTAPDRSPASASPGPAGPDAADDADDANDVLLPIEPLESIQTLEPVPERPPTALAPVPPDQPVTAETELAPVDRLFYALSSAADHGLLWLALGSARAARRGEPAIALRLGALLGAESILTNGVVKSYFRKRRPAVNYAHDAPLPYGMHRPITSSFPSGHAATAFMAASLLAPGRRHGSAYYALAALVAYSRVHVRMHYLPDIAAGAALGLVLGRLARRVVPLS